MASVATELLKRIPEELLDVPLPGLLGETPRQAGVHVEESGCSACRHILWEMGIDE